MRNRAQVKMFAQLALIFLVDRTFPVAMLPCDCASIAACASSPSAVLTAIQHHRKGIYV